MISSPTAISRSDTTSIPSDPRGTSFALALQSWLANRAGPKNSEGVFFLLVMTTLKSRLVMSRSFSSSGVIWTLLPQRYFMVSPFLIGRLAVIAASWVTIVYLLVVETSKGQSGSQIFMYFRMCLRKSSFSLSVLSRLTYFLRPESSSKASSAFCASLPRTTSRNKIAVTSSSLIPRVKLYFDRFFRIVVQKYTYISHQLMIAQNCVIQLAKHKYARDQQVRLSICHRSQQVG